jgi:hypothetical protein
MVGEALARHALNGGDSAVNVAASESDAVIVPEIKFREITVQVLFLAVLVDALHAAFEDRREAFNRVGMSNAAHVAKVGADDE